MRGTFASLKYPNECGESNDFEEKMTLRLNDRLLFWYLFRVCLQALFFVWSEFYVPYNVYRYIIICICILYTITAGVYVYIISSWISKIAFQFLCFGFSSRRNDACSFALAAGGLLWRDQRYWGFCKQKTMATMEETHGETEWKKNYPIGSMGLVYSPTFGWFLW